VIAQNKELKKAKGTHTTLFSTAHRHNAGYLGLYYIENELLNLARLMHDFKSEQSNTLHA
jgi:hypothetical protein